MRGYKEIELSFPLRGLGEAGAKVNQSPDRTRLYRNVWTRDPRTGEQRGASRAGFTRISEQPLCDGERIQALAPLSWSTPPDELVELTETPQANVTPSVVTQKWTKALEEATVDVQRAADGSIYALLKSGSIAVDSEDGAFVEVISSYVPQGLQLLPRLRVDERGGILVVASTDQVVPGGATVITRLVRDDEEWRVDWQQAVDVSARVWDYRPGVIAVAGPMPGGSDIDPDVTARISGILEGLPNVDWTEEVPQPIADLAFDRTGGVVVTAPANHLRAKPGGDGFDEPLISWVPYELRDWETRMTSLFRPGSPMLDGLTRLDGDAMPLLEDLRVLDTGFGTPPTDGRNVERRGTLVLGPTYKELAGGGIGAAAFDGEQGLLSALVETEGGVEGIVRSDGGSYSITFGWVLEPSTEVRRLFTHQGGPNQADLTIDYGGVGTERSIEAHTGAFDRALGTFPTSGLCIITIVWDATRNVVTFRKNGAYMGEFGGFPMAFGGPYEVAYGLNTFGGRTLIGTANDRARALNLLGGVNVDVQTFGAQTQDPDEIYDGNDSTSYLFSAAIPGFTVDFPTLERIEELVIRFRRSPSVQAITITAADDPGLTTNVETYTFEPTRDEEQHFSMLVNLTGEITNQHRYWRFEGDFTGQVSGADMRIHDCRFHSIQARPGLPAIGDFFGWMSWEDPTYPVQQNATGPIGAPVSDVTEVEVAEGYLAHDIGGAEYLIGDHPYTGSGNVPGGIGAPPGFGSQISALFEPDALVARYDARGAFTWLETGGAFGGRVAVFEDFLIAGHELQMRRDLMRSSGLKSDDEGSWAQTLGAPLDPEVPLRVDGAGDVYGVAIGTVDTRSRWLERYNARDGARLFSTSVPIYARGLALGPDIPTPEAIAGSGARWLILTGVENDGSQVGVHARYELTGQRRTGASSPRDVGLVVVGCGAVELYRAETGQQIFASGAGEFGADRDVATVEAFGELFLSDGLQQKVFRPRKRELVDFEPSGLGFGAGAPTILCLWGGRVVKAGFSGQPTQWAMTAQGDAYDEDVNPPQPYAGRAILGSLSRIGLSPRQITALEAINDDLLFWGTDAAIYRLTGDPTQGGQLDLITDEIGIAFGESVVKTPSGAVYFMASDGGIWTYTFSGGLGRVSLPWIEERLKDLDLRVVKPILSYSLEMRQIRVYLIRRDGSGPREVLEDGTRPPHFILEEDSGAWSELTFADDSLEPQALVTLDGDGSEDLYELVAGWDGRLRAWDRNAHDDDGVPIHSEAEIGPIDAGMLAVWTRPEVDLAVEQGAVELTMIGSLTADSRNGVQRPGRLTGPGANLPWRARVNGRYCYLRLRGADGMTPWAFERASISVAPKGRRRN